MSIPLTAYKPLYTFISSIRTQRFLVGYRNRFNKKRNISLPPVRQDFTILCNHIHNSFEHDHHKHWGQLIKHSASLRVKTSREFWCIIRRLMGVPSQYASRLIENTRSLTDPLEITHAFKEHWENIYTSHTPDPTVTQHVNNLPHLTQPPTPIT